MSNRLFPAGYGDGTGLSAPHSDMLERIESLMAGGVSDYPFRFATRAEDVTINVDPVNGDDSLRNNGLDTPLKTLDAAADRLPQFSARTVIQLAEGEFPVSDTPIIGLATKLDNPLIRGALEVVDSFDLDALVTDLTVTKDSGTPAWTTDEHKGLLVRWTYVPWAVTFHHFIMSNTAHALKLAWGPPAIGGIQWPYVNPELGATFEILDLKSILKPVGGFDAALYVGGQLGLEFLHVDGGGQQIQPGDGAELINMSFCKFTNGYNAYLGVLPVRVGLFNCWFQGMANRAVWFNQGWLSSTNGYFENCAGGIYLETARLIQALGTFMFGKNLDYLVDCGWGGQYIDQLEGVWADTVDDYLRLHNQGTYLKTSEFLKPLEASVLDRYLFLLTDGGNTMNLVDKGGGAGNTLSGTTNDFSVDGTAFDWSDYQTTHGQDYSDTKGNRIFG